MSLPSCLPLETASPNPKKAKSKITAPLQPPTTENEVAFVALKQPSAEQDETTNKESSKLMSIVDELIGEIMSNSALMNASNTSLSINGVFTTPEKEANPEKSSSKRNNNVEEEVKDANLSTLPSRKKSSGKSKSKSLGEIQQKENFSSADNKPDSTKKKKPKVSKSTEEPQKRSKKNKRTGKSSKKPKKKESKLLLERLSESEDICFYSSEYEDENWTDTETTLELSISSIGLSSLKHVGETSSLGDLSL